MGWDTYISDGLAVGSGKPIAQVSFHTGFLSGDERSYFPQSELDHVPASVKKQMPHIGVKVSLGVGNSQDTLAAERLALQVLLGAEKRPMGEVTTTDVQPTNMDIEELFDVKRSSIENLFDGNFDVIKAADIEDLFEKTLTRSMMFKLMIIAKPMLLQQRRGATIPILILTANVYQCRLRSSLQQRTSRRVRLRHNLILRTSSVSWMIW